MDHATDPTPTPVATRRAVLLGGIGAAGAAFLAACGSDDEPRPGVSGNPLTETTMPPEVPTTEPGPDALEMDVTLLRTAASLELAVAGAYGDLAGQIADPELRAAAERFGSDHEAAAEVFVEATPEESRVEEPNEPVQTQVIDPVARSVADDQVPAFLARLESMLVATYTAAAGTFTDGEWRQRVMEHGAASARRSAALGGTARAPRSGLYPTDDLIPGDAYLSVGGAEEE